MFTEEELRILAITFFNRKGFETVQDLAEMHDVEPSTIVELDKKARRFLEDDPRKPTTEIYGVIETILEDDQHEGETRFFGKPFKETVERIMTEIYARWELVDHETYKDLQNRANLYRSL
jgi:hypothetical protein